MVGCQVRPGHTDQGVVSGSLCMRVRSSPDRVALDAEIISASGHKGRASCQISVSRRKGFCNFARAIDEELSARTDRAVFQGDEADVTGRHLKIDLKGPQSKMLTARPQPRRGCDRQK